MDSTGIGNWGVFGQLVTVVAAALAAVYIIVDNVRRTTNDNSESPIELPGAVTVFYPPRRGGIFGRAFQRGRPYFGSRSPLRSIWELGTERPLVAQEGNSCQNRVAEIASRLEERSASLSSDDSADSPFNMEPVWLGDYRHDDESISPLPPPDRYLSGTAEESWEAMESHGSDVSRVSDRCVENSHARLQRLLQRDMERQAKVRTYQLWTSDGEKVKETVKLGKDWLKDVDKDWEKFNVEVCFERDDRMPIIQERNGSTNVNVEVSSSPCSTLHQVNVSTRYTPPRSFTRKPGGARTKYQEFSMPPKQDEDEEDCRQIPLLSNGDEPCLRAVDDTVSRKKKKDYVDLTETAKDARPNFKISSVTSWETPKRQTAQTVMSPNGIHPDNQSDATRSPKKDEGRRNRTTKPPIPPSSLPLSCQPESSKALFKARQQFFENLSKQNEATSPDCATKLRRFQQSTRQDRYRLVTSTPDLKVLEETVRISFPRPVPVAPAPVERRQPPAPPPRAWPHHARLNKHTRKHSKSVGYLETDIDTMESRTVMETNFDQPDRVYSMLTLRQRKNKETEASRARSVDQLTPEPQANQLGRAKSEYEIRVEKSLQNLSVPDWYKQSKWSHTNKDGFLLKKKHDRGWQEARSRKATLSMTNLNRGHGETKRGLRSADESPTSSTGSLSRWSSAKLSTASGPVFSWSSAYRTGRQPYLGWRASLTQSPTSSNQSMGSTPTSPDPGSCESSSKKILRYLGQDVQVVGSLEDLTEVTDKCEIEEDPKSPGSQSDHHLSIPRDRYSYMESIFNSDSCIPKRSAQLNHKDDSSKVVWIESSFVGSRATTSVAVMPDVEKKSPPVQNGTDVEINKNLHC